MDRQPRVDRASEYEFATICANAGVHPQKVSEDETGWDYLVEFPPDPNFAPADAQPAGRSAYAQIKSTIGRYHRTSITLSNARRMAQQGHPWFIVLFYRLPSGERRIYARHFWIELISESLKAVRAADLANEKLHKKTLTISFEDSDDHTGDLIRWIEETIAKAGVDYQRQKLNAFHSVGYEDGHGSIKFSFQSDNADEFAKALLGIGEVKIQNFEMTPKRFGMADQRGHLMASTATLQSSPATWKDCVIKIRARGEDDAISIPGKVAYTSFPRGYARFTSEFLEIVWSTDDNAVQFNSKITIEQRRSLAALVTHVRLLARVTSSDTDIQIWIEGRRAFGGRGEKARDPRRWNQLHPLLSFLHSLVADDISVSIAEIAAASAELRRFREIVAYGVSCTLEFTDVEGVPLGGERLLYSAQVTVGPATFFAIVERPVLREDQNGEQRHFELGDPRIVDSYAVSGAAVDEQFQADFEREINQSSRTLGIADIRPAFEGREIRIYTSPGLDRADGSVE
ncbi:hypothetical protein [Mesorhizobium argentiipisi]|uniref:DUF4365 domain-containing protein n=1 Tax=Mesorhizobium argentiipisi TaxID=3015175 RepID=A0ABU8KMF1_9HYPH